MERWALLRRGSCSKQGSPLGEVYSVPFAGRREWGFCLAAVFYGSGMVAIVAMPLYALVSIKDFVIWRWGLHERGSGQARAHKRIDRQAFNRYRADLTTPWESVSDLMTPDGFEEFRSLVSVRAMKKLLENSFQNTLIIGLVAWAAFVSVTDYWPASRWLEVRSVQIDNAAEGEEVTMTVDRQIHSDFIGEWVVSVRNVDYGGCLHCNWSEQLQEGARKVS